MFKTRNKASGPMTAIQNRTLNKMAVASGAMASLQSTSARFHSPVTPTSKTDNAAGMPFAVCGRSRCEGNDVADA